MWFIALFIFSCLLEIKAYDPIEVDYIECYWCNSRDMYCGKRVIDTMVSTVKCPKQSKCVVYTNPYDNYFLHRGCTYGMDLGEMVIKDGCYVEEEGATYCFCDFNRCNAAGILDLRNLVGTDLDISSKTKKNYSSFLENLFNEENNFETRLQKHPEKSPVLSSYPNTIKTSEVTSLGQITRNFKKLLTQYLSQGRYKNGIKADKFREQLNKIIQKNSNSQNFLNNYQNISEILKNANLRYRPTRPKIHPVTTNNFYKNTKSILSIELLKKINKLSTKFSTKKMSTRIPTSTPVNLPLLYKLKINDTISKSLLEDQSIRQKLGIKPNEHLNIVVKKPLDNDLRSEFQVTSVPDEIKTNNVQKGKQIANNNNFSALKYVASSTTLSWLSKLKAKLNQVLSSTQLTQDFNNEPLEFTEKPSESTTTTSTKKSTTTTKAPITHSVNDWTHILSDKYRLNLENVKFKCSNNGLFPHPINCSQFIQCVDFGTYFERFYVQNCPNGLYFNEKFALCDYFDNVVCSQEKRKF